MSAVDLLEEIRNRRGEILRLKKEIVTLEEANKVLFDDVDEPTQKDETEDLE